MPPVVKVCVLGSTGVGKSKLIQQFIYNHYDDHYEPTGPKGKQIDCSTMFNGNLYQMKIVDMPAIEEFPSDITTEWSEYHHCLLRNSHAYIFVFDLNLPTTFNYVKVLRDQLFDNRNMHNVPVWIVGNKADLCLNVLATMRSHRHHHHHHHTLQNRQNRNHSSNRFIRAMNTTRSFSIFHPSVQHQSISPYEELTPACKEFSNLVRKQWKCNYIECSAKYNWRIMAIFRELLKNIDPILQQQQQSELLTSGQQQFQQQQQLQSSTIITLQSIGKDKEREKETFHKKTIGSIGTSADASNFPIDESVPSRATSPTEIQPNSSINQQTNNSNRMCRIV